LEDDDFVNEFSKLMSDLTKPRATRQAPVLDVAVPMHLKVCWALHAPSVACCLDHGTLLARFHFRRLSSTFRSVLRGLMVTPCRVKVLVKWRTRQATDAWFSRC
jgi:hypothetical protein